MNCVFTSVGPEQKYDSKIKIVWLMWDRSWFFLK